MIINQQQQNTEAIKFSLVDDRGNEVGRAYLYLIVNDLHQLPYGFIEDVFISEKFRGQGYGKMLINQMINEAKKRDCYKLIATSRSGRDIVHHFYAMLGFIDYGKEFRLDLDSDYTP